MISRSYKYRMYPTEDQKVLLSKTFGCVRVVWNANVETFNSWDREKNPKPVYKTSTEIRAQHEWMKEVSAAALQQKEIDFKEFRKQFFSKSRKIKQARCRFKSKYDRQSYRLPNQKFTLKLHSIRLEKIGAIKLVVDRRPPEDSKFMSVTVSRDSTGAYYASVLVQEELKSQVVPTGKPIGIDLGLKDFVVTSAGERIAAPQHFRKSQAELKKTQRHMSRKKKGSNRYKKCKLKVARIHKHVAAQRSWFHHQVANWLLESYDFIGMEDLNAKGMVKNRRLAKSISDAGWSSFGSILAYKSSWRSKTIQKVDRFFPSSKLCSDCGAKNVNLQLSDREWVCVECGVVHDRDENAAVNVEIESLRIFGEGSIEAQGVACALRMQSGCKTPGFHPGASCVEASIKPAFYGLS
jgi:putative transposase